MLAFTVTSVCLLKSLNSESTQSRPSGCFLLPDRIDEMRSVCMVCCLPISRWAHTPADKPLMRRCCLRRCSSPRCYFCSLSFRFYSLHPVHRPSLFVIALGPKTDTGMIRLLCVNANTAIVYDRDAQAWLRSNPVQWRKVTGGGGAKKAVLLFHWLLMEHSVPY